MSWQDDSRSALVDAIGQATTVNVAYAWGTDAASFGFVPTIPLTPTQQSAANSTVAGWDWSQAAQTTRAKNARQAVAQTQVSEIPPDPTITELKALVMLAMDEINLLRKRLTDQDNAVAGAGTLAALKTAWATVAVNDPMPQRTPAQVENALQNRIVTSDVG